jgi:hypothetical protein
MFFQLDDNNQPQILHPVVFPNNLPHVVPLAPPVPSPQQLQPELEILPNQVLAPHSAAPVYYNGSTWSNGKYVALPKCFEIFNSNGERVPPIGYTFVSMVIPGSPTPSPEVGISCPPSPQLSSHDSNSLNSAPSNSLRSQPDSLRLRPSPQSRSLCPPSPNQGPVNYSREPSMEPADEQKEKPQKNRKVDELRSRNRFDAEHWTVKTLSSTLRPEQPVKKVQRPFRHRSKQERIQQVHEELRVKYTARGLYAGNDEVLRGFDTVRVHVKTYHALSKIQEPLDDVERHPQIQIHKIATPFSMKNRFQKKGFIVYLKLTDRNMVPLVQDIFAKYKEHFNKCDLALKKEDKIALQKQEEEAKRLSEAVVLPEPCAWMEEDDFLEDKPTFPMFHRPGMAKRSSLQGA